MKKPTNRPSEQYSLAVQSPGRINIIGEHTDYNDGYVLPAAIDKKTITRLRRNDSATKCRLKASNLEETHAFDLRQIERQPQGWRNYLLGVVDELQQLGCSLRGFDCEFYGEVPIGGGMSSSAALECSFIYGLNELFELGLDTFQMIKTAQKAENDFVGMKCGIMDQFASMMGRKDHVLLLDCRSLEYQYFPLQLDNYQILLLNTNVSHALASSEYNTRRSECEEGVAHLQKIFPGITSLRDARYDQLQQCRSAMPETVFRRCHHVVTEISRVLEAAEALQRGKLAYLGELMYRSHDSLQNHYEVSCPELDFLVDQTRDKDYVLGARMMGGGFGGCTINVIEKSRREGFVNELAQRYCDRFGVDLTPFTIGIEDGTQFVQSNNP